jgi:hypothetical protein
VLSVADRAGDDLIGLVADHEHLVNVFKSARMRASVAALNEHLEHGELLAASAL